MCQKNPLFLSSGNNIATVTVVVVVVVFLLLLMLFFVVDDVIAIDVVAVDVFVVDTLDVLDNNDAVTIDAFVAIDKLLFWPIKVYIYIVFSGKNFGKKEHQYQQIDKLDSNKIKLLDLACYV